MFFVVLVLTDENMPGNFPEDRKHSTTVRLTPGVTACPLYRVRSSQINPIVGAQNVRIASKVSINGERMFGPVVCPCDSRKQFLQTLQRSSKSFMVHGSATLPPRPPPPVPSGQSSTNNGSLTQADEEKRRQSSDSSGTVGAPGRDDDSANVGESTSWGRFPAVGELLPGFSSERPGFLDDETLFFFSSEHPRQRGRRRPHHRRWHSAAEPPRSAQREGLADSSSFVPRITGGGRSPVEEKREEEEKREQRRSSKEAVQKTAAAQKTAPAVSYWGGREKDTGKGKHLPLRNTKRVN